jgi:hypothetical protein
MREIRVGQAEGSREKGFSGRGSDFDKIMEMFLCEEMQMP